MYVYITVELIYEFEALKTILCKSTRRAEDLYSRRQVFFSGVTTRFSKVFNRLLNYLVKFYFRNGTTSMEDCLVECIKESVKHHHILLR